MELLFLILIIVLPLIALDAIVARYGVDSRLAVGEGKGAIATQRWI